MKTMNAVHVNQRTLEVAVGQAPAGYGYLYWTAFRRADDHPLRREGAWVGCAGPAAATASLEAIRAWIAANDSGENLYGYGLRKCDLLPVTTFAG
jgi:hypothetical protein